MSVATTLVRTAAVALVAVLAAVAGAGLQTAAAGGPTFTAGSGCAVQCITKALVTPTATTAKVELATNIIAHLTVTVSTSGSAGGGTGGLTTGQAKTVSISAFSPSKSASFGGLEPDTTYTITVKATDLKGGVDLRQGTLRTLAVQTAGHAAPGTLDSGVGCSLQCITKALFVQQQPNWSAADFDIRTATDAKIQVVVSLDPPVATASGLVQHRIVHSQSSDALGSSLTGQVQGLWPGTTYYAVVRATDGQGRTATRMGTFRTVSATATVTVRKLKILNDGDKWGKGELFFRYYVDGTSKADYGWRKLGTGDLIDAKSNASGRPGVWFSFDVHGPVLDLRIVAEECDALLMKNCLIQANGVNLDDQHAWTVGKLDLRQILGDQALPPWYGSGATPPAGHDGYAVLATEPGANPAFLALATVDLEVLWPS